MRNPRLIAAAIACVLAGGALVEAVPAAAQANLDIAFTTGRGTELFEVWAMNEDGTGQKRLITGPPGSIEVDAAISPPPDAGATQIAFARKSGEDETYDLMVKPLTGDAVKLTDENGTVATDRQPAWAPTAARIAFTRSIRAEDTSNVWAINSDGSGLTKLTETPAPGYDASPSWSTANEIAFVSDRAGGIPQIFTMDAAGVTETQVTTDACFHGNPAWSPASPDLLLFDRFCPGGPTGWDIYELNLTTSVTAPVVDTAANELQPGWAPIGDAFVFTRYPSGGGGEQIVKADYPLGTETDLMTDPAAVDLAPDWGVSADLTPRQEVAAAPAFPPGSREPAVSPARKPNKKKKTSRRVAKGIRFLQMRKAKSDVYVLKVDTNLSPRLDLALSNDLLPGHERTSRMAKRHGAIVAINGDFGTPSGRPAHTFAEDGDLKQISFAVSENFSMSQDEQSTTFARPLETVVAKEQDDWPVERWNFGEPGFGDIAAFTPAGGSLEVPPANACSARLTQTGGRRWGPAMAGMAADYQVTEVACGTTAMGAPAPGQVVLSAQPGSDGGILVGSLTTGQAVTLTWSIGATGVAETVGGNPLLLENGVDVVPKPCTTSLCQKHPRTGIGVTPTGRMLMVVVDGRRKDSKGVTLVRFARIMQGLHASFALNLDGGGSSTMVVQGKVVNEPSDGKQRKVCSAVLVIKGKDPGEAIGGPLPAFPSVAPPPANDLAGILAATDPGSTGGLAEAMAEGVFGPETALPRELRRALRLFRSAR
jgi:hypothetical protein